MAKFALVIASLVLVGMSLAHADEDDDFMEVNRRTSLDSTRRRSYLGGRDEQSLEIQATLPQPTRSPDGTTVLTEEDGPTTAPASD